MPHNINNNNQLTFTDEDVQILYEFYDKLLINQEDLPPKFNSTIDKLLNEMITDDDPIPLNELWDMYQT